MSFLMNDKSRFFIFLYVGIWPYMCMIWIFVNCLFSLQAGRLLLLMLLMQLPWEGFSAAFWCFPTKLPPKVGSSRCGQLLGGMLVIALSYSEKALSLGFRLVLLVSRCHLVFHKSFLVVALQSVAGCWSRWDLMFHKSAFSSCAHTYGGTYLANLPIGSGSVLMNPSISRLANTIQYPAHHQPQSNPAIPDLNC